MSKSQQPQTLQPLTSDDLLAMGDDLTRADWVRILRSFLELASQSLEAEEAKKVILFGRLLLQTLLIDGAQRKQLKEELEQELPSCTPNELQLLRRHLESARKPKSTEKEPNNGP